MKSIPEATPIRLTRVERAELEGLAGSRKTEHRLRQRARIVLHAADGMSTRAIGRAVGCTTGTASKWRVRYAEKRLAGLDETGNRGAVAKYTEATGRRILGQLDETPPAGHARWTAPLIAKALGDVDVQYVWRFLRAHKIDLAARKSWCESNDPEFAAKAADIVGLYLAPPENAIVLCVDEKPSIQALERKQGYLKLPNGRALTGQSHDYKRHGTSTLFAALEVATGKVQATHKKRRRRVEFLAFMNEVTAAYLRQAARGHPRQPQHPQAQERPLACTPSPRALPLHPETGELAQPGRDLVLDPARSVAARRLLQLHHRGIPGSTSMPSSPTTTTPHVPSPGPNPRSIRSASRPVSRINDSGY